MEIRYSATSSAWIGITDFNDHFVVVDDSYEYADCMSSARLHEGTYKECSDFADAWEAETRVTW